MLCKGQTCHKQQTLTSPIYRYCRFYGSQWSRAAGCCKASTAV